MPDPDQGEALHEPVRQDAADSGSADWSPRSQANTSIPKVAPFRLRLMAHGIC